MCFSTLRKAEKQDKDPESRLRNISSLFRLKVWGRWLWWKISSIFWTLRWVQSFHLLFAMLVSITEVQTLILLCVTGHAESLGPTFSRYDSLLARSLHSWLWTYHRVRLCPHSDVCVKVLSIAREVIKPRCCFKWNCKRFFVYHSQDSSSMKMIMLTKQNNSQVAVSPFTRNYNWSTLLSSRNHRGELWFCF